MGLRVKGKTVLCIVAAKEKLDMPIHTDSTFLAIHRYISIAASTCIPFLAVGRCSQQVFPELKQEAQRLRSSSPGRRCLRSELVVVPIFPVG